MVKPSRPIHTLQRVKNWDNGLQQDWPETTFQNEEESEERMDMHEKRIHRDSRPQALRSGSGHIQETAGGIPKEALDRGHGVEAKESLQ